MAPEDETFITLDFEGDASEEACKPGVKLVFAHLDTPKPVITLPDGTCFDCHYEQALGTNLVFRPDEHGVHQLRHKSEIILKAVQRRLPAEQQPQKQAVASLGQPPGAQPGAAVQDAGQHSTSQQQQQQQGQQQDQQEQEQGQQRQGQADAAMADPAESGAGSSLAEQQQQELQDRLGQQLRLDEDQRLDQH